MINLVITPNAKGGGVSGDYVFFFENERTGIAKPWEVQVRFDPSLTKPLVKVRDFNNNNPPGSFVLRGVEVYFKDREQMEQYWIVK